MKVSWSTLLHRGACAGILYACLIANLQAGPLQTAEPVKDHLQDLAGSRWNGTMSWSEARRTRNRTVAVPYSMKITVKFAADGSCTAGSSQPCKWERNSSTIAITLAATKND